MTAGTFLMQFYAICIVSLSGIALIYATLRDARLPPGPPPSIATLAPRCYALDLASVPEYRGDLPRPSWVQLLSAPESQSFLSGWYQARRPAADLSRSSHALPIVEQPHWRPAGIDSLDIIFPSFPMLLLLRIPSRGKTVSGRALVSDDVGGHLPDLWPGQVTAVSCERPADP